MSRRFVLAGLVPALVLLHFLIHVGFSVGSGAPDLLTLALLLASRETRAGAGAALGFVFGLLEDAFSALAFGASALAMTVVGILGAKSRDLFVGESPFFVFVYLGLGKLLRDLIYWVAAGETVREPFVSGVLIGGGFSALYVAVVGTGLVFLLGGIRTPR
jgi:rod shape-determining protein MreD